MSSPVTEVVVFTFLPGVEIQKHIPSLLAIFQRQEGFLKLAWGKWEESEDKVQLLLSWDMIESHKNFMNSGSEDFVAIGWILDPLFAAPPLLHHVYFTPPIFEIIAKAPVVEISTFYGVAPTFETDISRYFSILVQSRGFIAMTGGAVVEELASKEGGNKAKAYQVVIAWESIKDHTLALTAEEVKVEKPAGFVAMHHVRFEFT